MQAGRIVVYILGAGASRALGAVASYKKSTAIKIPIQDDFWDVFLKYLGPADRSEIEGFLFKYFLGYVRKPGNMTSRTRKDLLSTINVEEVFTFLSERSQAPSSSTALRNTCNDIWDRMVQGIGVVFSKFGPNRSSRKMVKAFCQRHIRRNDKVVSFNYDAVFEGSIPNSTPWQYSGLGTDAHKLSIIKPHGSVNWLNTATGIKISSSVSQPVVVAPTHLKFVEPYASSATKGYLNQSETLRKVWAELESEMRRARALVFVGYSFPPADLYFSSVLRAILAIRGTSPHITIVNPDAVAIAQRLEGRFSVRGVARYFDFEQFIGAKRV